MGLAMTFLSLRQLSTPQGFINGLIQMGSAPKSPKEIAAHIAMLCDASDRTNVSTSSDVALWMSVLSNKKGQSPFRSWLRSLLLKVVDWL